MYRRSKERGLRSVKLIDNSEDGYLEELKNKKLITDTSKLSKEKKNHTSTKMGVMIEDCCGQGGKRRTEEK